ncbi:MAG TPA: hypothetical protein PKV16_05030 [Caldisericia bacterium]|nr:hypothetical protein [Caldisericia bacterium]HPF48676.1 hypothetical protein [Caldisericia bacterium]HPI83664.1 hypothetical protein [Caldisericia bacterium]HPQ93131.1 hypothetical protein [Caldisericia bacterium]HRV75036.1 hypothetical protein [Caldisericia bacterium]
MRNTKLALSLSVMFLLLSTLFLGGCQEKVRYSADDLFAPLTPESEIEIPPKPTFEDIVVDYIPTPSWEEMLAKFVPIYPGASFLSDRKPNISSSGANPSVTYIEAEMYYKEKSEVLYTWLVDHLVDHDYVINRNMSNGEDPLIFSPVDGRAIINAINGDATLKIDITHMQSTPGWFKVQYSGSRNKRMEE